MIRNATNPRAVGFSKCRQHREPASGAAKAPKSSIRGNRHTAHKSFSRAEQEGLTITEDLNESPQPLQRPTIPLGRGCCLSLNSQQGLVDRNLPITTQGEEGLLEEGERKEKQTNHVGEKSHGTGHLKCQNPVSQTWTKENRERALHAARIASDTRTVQSVNSIQKKHFRADA